MMPYQSIEPVLTDDNRKPIFYVTWESTLKCNLDCTYCGKDAHDNSVPHPSLEECLDTADFLLEYANLYMSKRNESHRHVSMNIFGGESLFHPNIVDILNYLKDQHASKKYQWSLGLSTITNAVVKEKIWNRIVDLVDYFTISYHAEATAEQQELVRTNLLTLKNQQKNYHCAIMMHPGNWDNCQAMIEWCKENGIKYLPRQIDHGPFNFKFYYNRDQADWFEQYYNAGKSNCETGCSSGCESTPLLADIKKKVFSIVNLESKGRSCCGGTPFHIDQNYEQTQTHIQNRLKGWHCSVNYFFVFVKQVTGEIFLNKDCRVNFDQKVAPIGYLKDRNKIISQLKHDLEQDSLPTVICAKTKCWCGLCAPKAATKEKYQDIIQKYLV